MTADRVLNVLKILVLAKAIILLLIAGQYLGYVKIGEKGILAQNSSEVSGAVENSGTENEESAGEGSESDSPVLPDLEKLLSISEEDGSEVTKEEISRYLKIIEKKHQSASLEIEKLKESRKRLQNLEKDLDKKLAEIKEERLFIVQTLQKEKDLKKERLDRLIELYEKMEPKKAAPVFETMDKDLAAQLLKSLRQKQVTAILEKMAPEKALELTEYYGRVRSGAEYDLLREMNKSLLDTFGECK